MGENGIGTMLYWKKYFDVLSQSVFIHDESGKLLYANLKAVEMMGLEPNTSIRDAMKKFEMVDESERKISIEDLAWEKALKTGREEEVVVGFGIKGKGGISWFRLTSVPMREGKSIAGVVNTFYDITQERRVADVGKYLSRVSRDLASTISLDDRLKYLVNMMIPKLGDWCVADVIEIGGQLRRVAGHHSSPDKAALIRQLVKDYPSPEDSRNLVHQVIRNGKTICVPAVNEEWLEKLAVDSTHLKLIRKLNIRSVAIVPLQGRGRTFGTISIMRTGDSPAYTDMDVEMLENVVHRAAPYIDNGRLFSHSARQIKELKKVQKQLGESNETLKLALEAGRMGVWDWDIEHDDLRWSIGDAESKTTKQRNEGSFNEYIKKVHPGDRQNLKQAMKTAVKNLGAFSCQWRIGKNGGERWLMANGAVYADGEGKPVRMVGVWMDATDQKRIEETIRHNELKFKTIFEATLDAIILADGKGKVIDVNPATCHLTGFTKDELLTKTVAEIVAQHEVPTIENQWKEFMRTGRQTGEIDLMRKDVSIRSVEYKAIANLLPGTNVAILRDITEQKIEEKRREHFLGIAGHELKSPLATIKVAVQLLKRRMPQGVDEKVFDYMQRIDDKADTLVRLINDMTEVTRIRQGKLELREEEFDWDIFMQEIVRDMQLSTDTHTLVTEEKKTGTVVGDKSRLTQVVINLIKNAVKYSPDQNRVIVRWGRSEGEVEVSVTDFGMGIKKEDLKRVFELYYRGRDERKEHIKGMGMGLFISSEIVRQHKGKIKVESEPGKGSVFTFTLPLKQGKRK